MDYLANGLQRRMVYRLLKASHVFPKCSPADLDIRNLGRLMHDMHQKEGYMIQLDGKEETTVVVHQAAVAAVVLS